MPNIKEEIAKNLLFYRKQKHMTQKELAERLGVKHNAISSWENGTNSIDVEVLFKVCTILDVSINDMYGAKGDQDHFNPQERDFIKKYRALDRHGKEMVDVVLEKESARMAEEASRQNREEFHPAPLTQMPKAKKRRDGFVEIRVYDQPAAAGLGNYLDEPDFHIEQYPKDVIPDQTDFGIIISGDSMEPKVHDHATAFVQSCVSIDPGQIGIFILNATAYCKKLSINRETRQVRLVSVNEAYDDIIIQESDDFRTVGLVLGQWLPKQYR